jgi:glycosyltransferase involved in cell wall biosynthesis
MTPAERPVTPPESAETDGRLQVSVIVPARDDHAALTNLLELLEAQTLARDLFEVVIGDDGSIDERIRALASADGHVRVLPGRPRNSYVARNRAAGAARAPVLAFCDDDCMPEPSWLEAGLRALQLADVAGGPIRFRMPQKPTIWTLLDIDSFLDQERAIASGHGLGGNLFVRRELFERAGGFDETLPSGGDYDFVGRCVALGARAEFAAEACVSHPSRDRCLPLVRKVWLVCRSHASRDLRARRRPAGLKLRHWIPGLLTLRSRRRAGRPFSLDHARLRANRIEPRLRDDLLALPMLYIMLPYVGNAAHVYSWWQERRHEGSKSA